MRPRRVYDTARFVYLLKLTTVFLLYYVAAMIGLSLEPVAGFATLVWPPTGIALASLLLFGNKMWPAIAFGAFMANLDQGAPLLIALGICFGNTLEALAGSYLLKSVAGFRNSFEHLLDVFSFIFYAVILATVISATIGSTTLLLGGLVTNQTYGVTWLTWWIGDMLGNLIVAPFILLWFREINIKLNLRRFVEAIILLAFLEIISLVIFAGLFAINIPAQPINYLIYLPLIIIALRFGPKEYSLAMILLSATAIWGASNGYSIFARNDLVSSLFVLGTFLGSTAATFLSVSVLMQEKRILEARKDEFLAIASHELKTPATTIKAYVDLLKKQIPNQPKDFGLYITRMDEQIQRLVKLVNDMLDINRISTGKMELGTEKFLVAEFVRKNVRDIQRTTKHKLLFRGRTSARVLADKYKMSQVLTNILSNAVKFSPQNKKIIISVSSNKKSVKISIKDSGEGISQNYQEEIFKRFFQVSSAHRNGKVGLGLGLYISGEIIRRHGGKMWVRSTPGKGSTFYFTLPKAKRAR